MTGAVKTKKLTSLPKTGSVRPNETASRAARISSRCPTSDGTSTRAATTKTPAPTTQPRRRTGRSPTRRPMTTPTGIGERERQHDPEAAEQERAAQQRRVGAAHPEAVEEGRVDRDVGPDPQHQVGDHEQQHDAGHDRADPGRAGAARTGPAGERVDLGHVGLLVVGADPPRAEISRAPADLPRGRSRRVSRRRSAPRPTSATPAPAACSRPSRSCSSVAARATVDHRVERAEHRDHADQAALAPGGEQEVRGGVERARRRDQRRSCGRDIAESPPPATATATTTASGADPPRAAASPQRALVVGAPRPAGRRSRRSRAPRSARGRRPGARPDPAPGAASAAPRERDQHPGEGERRPGRARRSGRPPAAPAPRGR